MGDVKTIIKKWIAILIILVIFIGQYAITGFLATSYAIDLLATQSENVQFRAYFKNGEEELTDIESSIDAKDLKLKIDVAVKNQGYFNGQISLANAGFELDEATANNYIKKVENNIIYLNQINSEETANIEVGIIYFEDDKIQASTLSQTTTVKLNGTYTGSNGNTTIDSGSDVRVTWKVPENTKIELASTIQTNSTYSVNGENKKIVQFLTSSRLTNNAYPVKSTQITATIPAGATNVEVHKRTTKATNGEQDFTSDNYNVENNILTININNTEADGKVSWMKNVLDILVVTLEYHENIDLSAQNITLNEKITTQNNIELNAEQIQLSLTKTIDRIASVSKQENETLVYKGKIYSGEEREFTSNTIVYVDYVDGIKDIEITEYGDIFGKNEDISDELRERAIETGKLGLIKSIKINKDKVVSVLGNTWTLTIGDKTITNETTTNENEGINVSENGDITVQVANGTKILTIHTSKPVNNGSFIIETTKSITKGDYTREQIKEFEKIADNSSIKYVKNNDDAFTYTSTYNIGLKEPESNASLQSEQTALILGTENQALNLTAVLKSNRENQDLYKNPELRIKLPSQIKNVTFMQKPQLLQENGLELTDENYKVIEENGQKVLIIKLTGEQTSYLGQAVQGTIIKVYTNVEIDQNAQNSQEEIVMTYTNENATKYTDNGIEKVNIQISAAQTQGGNTGSQSGEQGNGTENQEGNQGQGGNTGTGEQNTNAELKYEVSASVGGQAISEGDTVKAGEIITYTAKITNQSASDKTGIKIEANMPENTTLIEVNSKYPSFDEETQTYTSDEPYFIEKSEKTLSKDDISIKANETYEYKYMVKVNSDLSETKQIEAIQTISYNNQNVNTSLKNTIAPGALETKLNLAFLNDSSEISCGYEYIYQLYITNNTNEEQKNVYVKLNVNDLMEKSYIEYSSDGPRERVETEGLEFTIPSIKAKDTAYVEYGIKIKDYTNKLDVAEATGVVKDSNNNEYRSNKVINEVAGVILNAELKATTEKSNSNYLNLGEEITYTITIKNTGKTDTNSLSIEDKFSKYLDLKEVTLNGILCQYTEEKEYDDDKNYNTLKINSSLKAGEEANLIIKGKVKEDLSLAEDLEVINQVDLYDTILLTSSEENIYYLKSTVNTEDNNGTDQENDNETTIVDDEGNITISSKNAIYGTAWLDANENGQRDPKESLLEGVKATLFDIERNIEISNTTTNKNGLYYFTNVNNGKYVIIFEYHTGKYSLTAYQVEGAELNSDAENITMNINGEDKRVTATDTLTLNEDSLTNIDIGLIEAKKFDLSLSKTISNVTISNSEGNKNIEFSDTNLAKVEIKGKYLKNSVVVVEYKIKVTNNGEVAGYAKKIVDNKPADLKFSSTLNTDWYQSGNTLYTTSLENELIEPGETKEITLILTKKMTASNTGLTNNKAKIEEYYNSQGITDENSSLDDDISQADLIVSVSTGIAVRFTLITIFISTIITISVYMITKKHIREKIN